jgi:hypothetical protein
MRGHLLHHEMRWNVSFPGLHCGENLAKHLTPPEHRPVERRAHMRRLEYLSEVRGFVRVRHNSGTLVLYNPAWRPEVQGNVQAVLLRRESVLGHQESVLAVRCDQKDARDHELTFTSSESTWTEARL